MTKEELDQAYELVTTAEKQLVTELMTLAEDIKAMIKDLKDKQPTGGQSSPARQYLQRLDTNLSSLFSYDLDAVRNTYGMQAAQPTS